MILRIFLPFCGLKYFTWIRVGKGRPAQRDKEQRYVSVTKPDIKDI